jgi:hypothetical protein
MTWQRPPSSPTKKLKATPSVRKTRGGVLCVRATNFALIVDFLKHREAATAGRCIGTLREFTVGYSSEKS